MSSGEKLFRFLAGIGIAEFYRTVTINFEAGKVTHVEVETRRMWRHEDLPRSDDGIRANNLIFKTTSSG